MEFCWDSSDSFSVRLHGEVILLHKADRALFYIGKSQFSYPMYRGHFLIEHEIQNKQSLQIESINEIKSSQLYEIVFTDEKKQNKLQLKFIVNENRLQIEFPETSTLKYIRSVIEDDEYDQNSFDKDDDDDQMNLWFSLEALPFEKESIHGNGLQFGNIDHRGKILPIWVSEWYHQQLNLSEVRPLFHTSYHPQPIFQSSRGYTFSAYGSAYAQFDFSHANYHRFHFASMPYRLEISVNSSCAPSPFHFTLPQWIHNGIILAVQGGTDVIDEKLRRTRENGTRVAGVWAQDWSGQRITSFGKRVFWNWQSNQSLYRNLKEKILEWQNNYDGCRF